MIKAWYAEEEKPEDGQQQRTETVKVDAAAFAADAAGTDAEDVAGSTVTALSTAAATTKQSAQLELGASQQLQSSHTLADWQLDEKGSAKAAVAVPPAAAGDAAATAAGKEEDEAAPLLMQSSNDCKQPLPLKAVSGASRAAAGTAAATDGAAAAAAVDGSDVTIRGLLASPAVLVFLWRALIIGLGLGAIGNFLFL
jgi:hypothetical protein